MRKFARVDDNHAEIAAALRQVGCSVQSLASLGNGCPDLLVGTHKANFLLEIKDGRKSPSKRRLTPDEKDWHEAWRGQVCVVESVNDALKAVGMMQG